MRSFPDRLHRAADHIGTRVALAIWAGFTVVWHAQDAHESWRRRRESERLFLEVPL